MNVVERSFTQSILRLRWTVVINEYGSQERGVSSSISFFGRVEQTAATEITVNRNTQVTDWLLFAPTGTDILSGDQIQAESVTLEVVGNPSVMRTVEGQPAHVEARLIHVD